MHHWRLPINFWGVASLSQFYSTNHNLFLIFLIFSSPCLRTFHTIAFSPGLPNSTTPTKHMLANAEKLILVSPPFTYTFKKSIKCRFPQNHQPKIGWWRMWTGKFRRFTTTRKISMRMKLGMPTKNQSNFQMNKKIHKNKMMKFINFVSFNKFSTNF